MCDSEILTCPWHGWEFDVTSGESVFNPHRWSVTTYETDGADPALETLDVGVEDGIVIVYV